MSILDSFMVAMGFQVDTHGLDKFENKANEVRESALQLGDVVGGVLAGAFGEFFKSFIDAESEIERFKTILGVLDDSTVKGGEDMEWIDAQAAKMPYQLAEVTDAFIKLKTYGIDPTKGALTAAGDAAAAMGKPIGEAVQAINMATFGMYRSLRSFGIEATAKGKMLSMTYMIHGQQMVKTVDKTNKVVVAQTLQAIWNEKYGGSMVKLSHTWAGMITNVLDNITRFKERVMESGPFKEMEKGLSNILDLMDKAFASWDINRYASDLALAFETVAEAGKGIFYVLDKIISNTVGWKVALVALAGIVAGVLVSSIGATVSLVWKLTSAMMAFDVSSIAIAALAIGLTLIINDLWVWYHGGNSLLKQLTEKYPVAVTLVIAAIAALGAMFIATKVAAVVPLAEPAAVVAMYAGTWIAEFTAMAIATTAATWPLMLIVAGVVLVVGAAIWMYTHWSTVTKFMAKGWHGFVNLIMNSIHWIVDQFDKLGQTAENFIGKLPGGKRFIDLIANVSDGGSRAYATSSGSTGMSHRVIGKAGTSMSSSATNTHSNITVNAPITIHTNDPDRAGKSVKDELNRTNRNLVRNGQTGVTL